MAKRNLIKNTLLSLSIFLSAAANAGVVFVPTANTRAQPADNEEYPESHFGQGYAAEQVNDMETPDEETGRTTGGATRGIASVGDNPNSGNVSETPIITSQAAINQEVPDTLVARKGVQEVSVIASDLGYFPKTIFVNRDVPVRMYVTGASKNTLCIMMDSFQVRKELKSQKIEEITFVPNVPGKYRFYCPVNGMEGNMVVRELGSPQEQTAGMQPEPAPAVQAPRAPAGAGQRNVPTVSADWHSALEDGSR